VSAASGRRWFVSPSGRREVVCPALLTGHRLAATMAVLPPLCDRGRVAFPADLDAVNALSWLWHDRVLALKDVNYPGFNNPEQYKHCLDCPPYAFALPFRKRRPCSKRFCPFCYGSEVMLIYENLQRSIVRNGTEKMRLYVGSRVRRAKRLDGIRGHIDDLTAQIDRPKTPGLIVRNTVDVCTDGGYQLRQAVIVVAPEDYEPSPRRKRHRRTEYRHAWEITKPMRRLAHVDLLAGMPPLTQVKMTDAGLAFAVARLCRYPAGYMYAAVDKIAPVMDFVRGWQSGKSLGIFRLGAAAKCINQIRKPPYVFKVESSPDETSLGDAEPLVCRIIHPKYEHELYAVRKYQELCGLGSRETSFADLSPVRFPLVWAGRCELDIPDLFRSGATRHPNGKLFRDTLRALMPAGLERPGGCVMFVPGLGFLIVTKDKSPVPYEDRPCIEKLPTAAELDKASLRRGVYLSGLRAGRRKVIAQPLGQLARDVADLAAGVFSCASVEEIDGSARVYENHKKEVCGSFGPLPDGPPVLSSSR
jgi:hypothetical protein